MQRVKTSSFLCPLLKLNPTNLDSEKTGLDANKHLSPEMSDALQLLRLTERMRFGAMCLQERYCTHAELLGFGWEEQSLDTAVLNRFWHTYSCTFLENVYLCPGD